MPESPSRQSIGRRRVARTGVHYFKADAAVERASATIEVGRPGAVARVRSVATDQTTVADEGKASALIVVVAY
ncbi:MAG TPA: hypothetical protein VGG60_12990 [Candidatus Binataceae bacterium]